MNNAKQKTQITQMTQLALLIAILAILTITNLGLIPIGAISITILHIPVIIGSITMGPKGGSILGLTFGILAMLQATFRGVTPVDLMFTPAASGMPVQSIIMCIVPRVLLGVIPYFLFVFFEKIIKKDFIAIALSAAISTALHTIMVLGCLYFMFFDEMSVIDSIKSIFMAVVATNGLLEIVAAVIICSAVCVPLRRFLNKNS